MWVNNTTYRYQLVGVQCVKIPKLCGPGYVFSFYFTSSLREQIVSFRTKLVGDECVPEWPEAVRNLQDGGEYAIRSQATYYGVPAYFCFHGIYEWVKCGWHVVPECRVSYFAYVKIIS